MADEDRVHPAADRAEPRVPHVRAARAQVAAARQRQEALIAGGQPLPETADLGRVPGRLPEHIGRYHIKRVIASGGMGTVYEATQENPRRVVAVKVMKKGIASRSALRRFEYEGQILGRLRHPGIAQIFEAGTHVPDSSGGQEGAEAVPFFAMEYIPNAKPIIAYAQEKKPSIRERMKLFVQVCDAVHHGHQKGIIHRDLKPSNILVDSTGQVKIIDFGVARSTDSDLAVTTLQTDVGQLVGTLQYMSPEQCEADPHDIDIRSDVYALGVVFYELLCDKLPYDVRGLSIHQATRLIREQAPTSTRALDKTLRGDIETIALKALEKERSRRYQSAAEFGQDIQRYLDHQAIQARRPSVVYQIRVFARRNKAAFSAIAATFVILVAGMIVSTSLYLRAEHAREEQSRERERAESFGAFLKEMLTLADPAKAKGEKLTMREALDKAAQRIEDGALRSHPLVEADVRFTIGSTYFGLGLYPQAETHLRAAAALRSSELGDEHPETLRTRSKLAESLAYKSDFAAAAMLAQPTLEAQQRVLSPDHPDTLRSMIVLGDALILVDRFSEAESLLRSVVERRGRNLGENHPETADAMDRLGVAYILGTYPEKAEPLHREALRIHTAALGEEDPATLNSMNLLGASLYNQARSQEAEPIFRRALELSLRVRGPEHPETIGIQGNLAGCVGAQGRKAEAEPMYREVLDASLRTMGRADRSTLTTQRWLAGFLASQRRYPEAETLLREALKAAVEKYGPEHGDTSIRLMCALADVLAQQRKDAEAEQVARQVLEFQHRQRPRPPPTELRQSSSALIGVLLRRGANDEALRIEREMIEFLLESSGGPEVSAARLDRMARTLLDPANKQLRDAPQALGLALQASERSGRKNPNFLNTLARAYLLAGYSGDAATVWEEAIALLPDDPARAQTLNRAAWELLTVTPESARDPAKAVEFALRANELSDYKNPGYVGTLARAYLLMGDAARATELWEQASALQPDDKSRAAMLNEAAWDLLTVTPESFRDPAAAMTFTLRSNELSGYQNPVYLDSLALACFRTGATIKAIEVQKQALELMAHDASERSEYEARLAEYEAALAAQSASGPSPP